MTNRLGWAVALVSITFGLVHCVGNDETPPTTTPSMDGGSSGTSDATVSEGGTPSDDAAAKACNASCGSARCFEGVCDGDKAVAVATGNYASCAVLKSGSIWCWGDDSYGDLGNPASIDDKCPPGPGQADSVACQPRPTRVAGIDDAKQVSIGAHFACALRGDGTVWCWGLNQHNQLGHDGTQDEKCNLAAPLPCRRTPTKVEGLSGVQSVTAASDFACAVSSGHVSCWGLNDSGQLGRGATGPDSAVPAPVKRATTAAPATANGTLDDAISVTAAAYGRHACAVRTDRTLVCWGDNKEGELGHDSGADASCTGGNPCSPFARLVPSDTSPLHVTGAAASAFATCAITDQGGVLCFGSASDGLAPTGAVSQPTAEPGLAQVGALDARTVTACAIDGEKKVFCWGSSGSGRLGNASEGAVCGFGGKCSGTPEHVPGLDGAVEIAMGTAGLARLADGTVLVWGGNLGGLLGHKPVSPEATCSEYGATAYCNKTPTALTIAPPP